ncbi:MAG TPA: preprotein translocase subunit SecG [Rhizobacter sp.]|nr:preprotein translocase subunit SecG [Rhizobacter sp.]HSC79119.1 preprotein translocase subunit SecG [Chitinolyticbacter sp.]
MQVLMNVVVALQIIAALVMIGLVLIQHGKGADMGASFGSGASGSLFGATGSANFLSRSTAVCAAVFFCCTLALAYTANNRGGAVGTSVLDRAGAAASAPAGGAMPIPGAAPGASAAAPAPVPAASAPAIPVK